MPEAANRSKEKDTAFTIIGNRAQGGVKMIYYFTDEEINQILSINIDGVTFESIILDCLNKKLSENKNKISICTSHDIFPIYQKVFSPTKKFYKDSSFLREKKLYLKNRASD